MNYTDEQLKQALARMLLNKVRVTPSGLHLWWNPNEPECGSNTSRIVLDTELLHLCWLVEGGLDLLKSDRYISLLWIASGGIEQIALCSSWQNRTIALCKVKGIEIV
jgi:hypothetical protein